MEPNQSAKTTDLTRPASDTHLLTAQALNQPTKCHSMSSASCRHNQSDSLERWSQSRNAREWIETDSAPMATSSPSHSLSRNGSTAAALPPGRGTQLCTVQLRASAGARHQSLQCICRQGVRTNVELLRHGPCTVCGCSWLHQVAWADQKPLDLRRLHDST